MQFADSPDSKLLFSAGLIAFPNESGHKKLLREDRGARVVKDGRASRSQ
jgi:hypothetical protein